MNKLLQFIIILSVTILSGAFIIFTVLNSNPLTYDSLFKGFYSANGTEILVGTVGEPVTIIINVPVEWPTYKGEILLSIKQNVAWSEDTFVKTQKLGVGEHHITFIPVEATKYPIRNYYIKLDSINVGILQVKEN